MNAVCDNPLYDTLLNDEITEREILDAIKGLKNNKSPGLDSVFNEYLKNSPLYLIRILHRLFNLVLDTGIIPENWTIGIIKPVYKNKGNNLDPDNLRAITLISCLGKLFTSILNERLSFFDNEISLISFNQAGFRKRAFYHRSFIFTLVFDIFLPSFSEKNLFVVSLTSARRLTQCSERACGRK